MKQLKKFFEMSTTRTYEDIVKDLMDNFDDNRMAISFIEELKELDKWQDFLDSEDGKLFKELRKNMR
jgi:hypothetical protein